MLTNNIAKIILSENITKEDSDNLDSVLLPAIENDKILIFDSESRKFVPCSLILEMKEFNLFDGNVQGKWRYEKLLDTSLLELQRLLSICHDLGKYEYFKKSIKIDLSGQNLNPYILGELLESIGYQMEEDALVDYTNGCENDFWIKYELNENSDYFELPKSLEIFGSLMTFELGLYI